MKTNSSPQYNAKKRLHLLLVALFFSLFNIKAFSIAPTANFVASNQAICTGNSTTFTNTSTGTITTYSWNFGSGASPATANTAGPHTVTYTTSGMKTITLTVSGPDGNSTLTKTNYIAVGADRIKLMSYNLLNYDVNTTDTTQRNPYFRTIMAAADPDILVIQELISLQALNSFRSYVLNANSNQYSQGAFINGFDTDNGIYFKTSKFTYVSNTPIETDLRDINEFKLVHTLTGDTIRIYSLHLKASNTAGDPQQRALEVDSLRKFTNALPAGKDFIVCGDFNIYGSNESAYQKLLADNPTDDGNFIDPINLTGTWNQSGYAMYHTQSTRLVALGSGGSDGGLDDRFDMILFSNAVNQSGGISYVAGSTIPYGNDGLHYNKSVNDLPTNAAVGQTVADALYNASDHLPVIASFDFQLDNCQALDIGATALLSPSTQSCPSAQKTMQVRITNYGFNTINFSSTNADVVIQVTNPLSVTSTFTKTISSGSLAPSATLDVTFTQTIDMSVSGNYTFNAYTVLGPDVNTGNNSMPASIVNITPPLATSITPPGPIGLCIGTSVNLSANNGSNYLWSNGQNSQTINVTNAGNYSVSFTDVNGCLSTSSVVNVTMTSYQVNGTVFSENVGSVSSTTSIATHEANNGFQNTAFTMSGTADIRNTVANNQNSQSGGANVFFTNSAGRNFIISGINTASLTGLQLTVGIQKSTTSADGSDFLIETSTDGVNYSTLSFPLLQTGTGTTAWQYISSTSAIPAVPNLSLRFTQLSVTPSNTYRLDDISLNYNNTSATVTPPGPLNICQGSSVVLNCSSASSYLWSNGSTTQGISVTSAGNYSVVATSSNGCTTTSNVVAVTVTPLVTASLNISANPGTTICSGSTVTFTAVPSNGGTTPVYQWKRGTTNVGSNSTTYAASNLNNGEVVTCIMTSNATCVSGSPATSNPLTMTVNPVVIAGVNINASPGSSICPGTTVTFTASPVNGGTTPAYQWKKNNVNVGTNSSTFITNTLSNNDIITCIMTSNANCVSGNPATSNILTMTVSPVVSAGISISANPGNSICEGSTVTFTATPVNGGTSPVYQWKKNGNNTGTNSSVYSTSTLLNGDMITCEMTSNEVCISGNPAISNTISMNVSANLVPTVTLSSNPGNVICPGTNVIFTASPVNGGTAPNFNFKINGSSVQNGSSDNYSNSALNDNDVVSCEMTSNETCLVTSTATSNSLLITVNSQVTWYLDSDADGFYVDGSAISQCSSPGSGYTTSVAGGGDCNDQNSLVNPGATEICSNQTDDNCNGQTDENCTVTLQLKLFIEGFYLGNNTMQATIDPNLYPSLCDTIRVLLHSAAFPYTILYADTTVIDINGNGTFNFPSNVAGNSFYIDIRHRNALQTWSAAPVTFNATLTDYDFTTLNTQAYGNNMHDLGDGNYGLISGDIIDADTGTPGVQDGIVESSDYGDMENGTYFTYIGYTPEDLTGDGIVESSDYSLMENNLYFSALSIHP